MVQLDWVLLLNSSWNSEVRCLFEHSSLHLVATKYWMRTHRRSLSKDQCMMKYWTQLEWTSHLIITRKVNFTVAIQQKHLLIILSPELFTKFATACADNKIWFRMLKWYAYRWIERCCDQSWDSSIIHPQQCIKCLCWKASQQMACCTRQQAKHCTS